MQCEFPKLWNPTGDRRENVYSKTAAEFHPLEQGELESCAMQSIRDHLVLTDAIRSLFWCQHLLVDHRSDSINAEVHIARATAVRTM